MTIFESSSKNNSKIVIYLVTILVTMFNIVDVKIAGFSKVWPLFDVMFIFYFAIFNRVFSSWFVFLIGLFGDALNSNPLGMTSLLYIFLIEFFEIVNQRFVIRDDFKQIFYQFILFLALLLFLKWIFISLYNSSFYDVKILIIQLILSGFLYVVVHKFCDYLSNKSSQR